jgi:hypothetical protein
LLLDIDATDDAADSYCSRQIDVSAIEAIADVRTTWLRTEFDPTAVICGSGYSL